ncbi:vitamin B12 ABC transporter ATP-binding protein BtuD [Salinivibrio costicola subsp. alcaliphilus]|uniref:Vitamin B12 ABC transporter ATP-binding protein BtuD n=1 Tax=Salinivibrio costicola subsp. alcaliphilus TaxID=272773 RepID=A0ABX3KTT5_SALCS|nr:vitamin B12 ABC transporter ATP-binding protein BtuD [Salinivibrio costicola subsp. alcaliphilus]
MVHAQDVSLPPRLFPLSLSVEAGQVVHLIGPNGSGKSTLLQLLSGLEMPETGHIAINSQRLGGQTRQTLAQWRGYLMQHQRPAFVMAVFEYLSLVLDSLPRQSLQQMAGSARDEAVNHIASRLAVSDKLHRRIDSLSGGEWQRVRLAGALLQVLPSLNPHACLLLLDEPATGLDVAQQEIIYQEISMMAATYGIAIVMANHDLNRTLVHADKVLLLNQGRLVATGRPGQVLTDRQLSEVFATPLEQVSTVNGPVIMRARTS